MWKLVFCTWERGCYGCSSSPCCCWCCHGGWPGSSQPRPTYPCCWRSLRWLPSHPCRPARPTYHPRRSTGSPGRNSPSTSQSAKKKRKRETCLTPHVRVVCDGVVEEWLTRSRCCWALCCCCCFRSLSASCCISSRASAGGFPVLVSPEEGAPDQPELPAPGPCCWGACCSNFMINSCCWRHYSRKWWGLNVNTHLPYFLDRKSHQSKKCIMKETKKTYTSLGKAFYKIQSQEETFHPERMKQY